MAVMIKGIPVTLYERTKTGEDAFHDPIYAETAVVVDNVLVQPLSASEILETLNLTGKRAVYQLGVPKGDSHEWSGCDVEFFGKRWHVIADVIEGIEDLIPLDWNKKIRVEAINGGEASN